MYEQFVEWLEPIVGSQYLISRGEWVEAKIDPAAWIASVQQRGGPPSDAEDRRQRFRVILLGPQGERKHAASVGQTAEQLAAACMGDTVPCGAAIVHLIGEPIGPAYTVENRAWYSIEIQVTF